MITHHTQLLNALIQKHNLKSYLEIGVQHPPNNFDLIRCDYKSGVDPAIKDNPYISTKTSDEYFEWNKIRGFKWDLIFIDGLHHADQVKRDFENSLRCLSDNGFIVIHDCLPENEEGTLVPRQTKIWWGDVYKFIFNLNMYSGINFKTFNIDNGCCLVWKNKTKTLSGCSLSTYNADWKFYLANKSLMNVVDEVII